jgi:type II secretory pathway component HofQ
MRTRVARRLAFVALIAVPATSQAQVAGRINVDYENAPLSRVIENFATYSGRTITLAQGIDDRVVTTSVRNMDWELGLDQILAAQLLVARPDSGFGLRIERERRVSVEYQDAPLSRVLHDVAKFAGLAIVLTPAAGDPQVTVSIRDVDWQRALDQILAPVGLIARPNRHGALQIERRGSR